MFTYRPSATYEDLKAYFGLEFSEDGWTAIIGAKIAGVKVIIPWTGVQNFYSILTGNAPH
jgi:hypothetical protein